MTSTDARSRARAVFGVLLLVVAGAGLAADLPVLAETFYAWVWWGWILLLDAFCCARRGASLLTTRRRLFLPLAIASVSFWFLFEALNLRFQNWYYVGCFRLESPVDVALCGAFGISAFATVFVGIFETIDALGAAGLWRHWRGRARPFPAWVPWAVQGLGAAMAAAAVLFPMWLAPLIWGSLSFLVDPWNYRHGRRSLLGDLEAAEYGRVGRIFVGGLVCGLVWESLNFIAPQKWIYTVRGLEDVKLFEMPVLGFLGFPALALDSVAAFSVLSTMLFSNATWQHPDDAGPVAAAGRDRRRGFYLSVPAQLVAWVVISLGIMRTNVGSCAFEIDDLETLSVAQVECLSAHGLRRPRALLRGLESGESFADCGLGGEVVAAVQDELELMLFKGIGPWHGRLLRGVGVQRIGDLAAHEADELHARLAVRAIEVDLWTPRLAWVDVWVRASRDGSALSVTD